MPESREIRTRISRGYQVVVPSEVRRKFDVGTGDEVIWVMDEGGVRTDFRKRPSIENLIGLGKSGKKESSVALKKVIQRGGQ